MKTFQEFMNEVYDPEIQGRSQIRKTGEGGRLYPSKKKSDPERRRMKATGGGKQEPVQYKDRKDIGTAKPKSQTQQQPTKERGSAEVKQSYADKVKAERRKAAQARAAAKQSGGTTTTDKPKSKETEKAGTKLLSTKKPEKSVSYCVVSSRIKRLLSIRKKQVKILMLKVEPRLWVEFTRE